MMLYGKLGEVWSGGNNKLCRVDLDESWVESGAGSAGPMKCPNWNEFRRNYHTLIGKAQVAGEVAKHMRNKCRGVIVTSNPGSINNAVNNSSNQHCSNNAVETVADGEEGDARCD